MTKAFKAPRLIGLLALLAGFMAFGATAAQAEPNAYWEVGGTKLVTEGVLLTKINAKKDTKHIILLTKSGLSTVEILCAEIKLVNGLLHQLGRFTGKIHFDNCETYLNATLASACKPHSPEHPEGLIETEPLLGLLKLHPATSEDLLELFPLNVGEIFVTLQLGIGKCSIGNNIPLAGLIFLKDCTKELLANKVEHLLEEQKALTILLFGKNTATIDGSFWAFLQGAHAGQSWSGHPALPGEHLEA